MQETILKALERTESPQQARRAGFIPGVIMGEKTSTTSVKFDAGALNKIILQHGKNAKVWIESGTEKNFGIIMDVQKHPVEGKIIHVSVKLYSTEQEVQMELPINFHGRDELENRKIEIHVYKSEVEVSGKAAHIPDSVTIDVSHKGLADTITVADLNLPKELKILDSKDVTYAVFRPVRVIQAEEPVEVKPATV